MILNNYFKNMTRTKYLYFFINQTNLLDINEFAKLMKDLAPGLKPTEV